MKAHVNLQYLAELFLEYEMFHTKVVDNQNIHCTVNFFFFKSCRLRDEENYGADNTEHRKDAICLPNN